MRYQHYIDGIVEPCFVVISAPAPHHDPNGEWTL